MRVVYEVESYNTRRYGKPWIAKVVAWPIGKHPELRFGGNVGTNIAEIEAEPGDLVKAGQKDHRNAHNVNNDFCVVKDDGGIRAISDEAARNYWLERTKAPKAAEPEAPAPPAEAPAPDETADMRRVVEALVAWAAHGGVDGLREVIAQARETLAKHPKEV